MISARFIKISDLPLTSNKKIDGKKLKASNITSESKKTVILAWLVIMKLRKN